MKAYEKIKSFLGDMYDSLKDDLKYVAIGAVAAIAGCTTIASHAEVNGLVKKLVKGKGNYGTYDQATTFVMDEADYNKDGIITKQEFERVKTENPWIEEEYQKALDRELKKLEQGNKDLEEEIEAIDSGAINSTILTKKVISCADKSKLPKRMVQAYEGKLSEKDIIIYRFEVIKEFSNIPGSDFDPVYRVDQPDIKRINDYLGKKSALMHMVCEKSYSVMQDVSELREKMELARQKAVNEFGANHELSNALGSYLEHQDHFNKWLEETIEELTMFTVLLSENGAENSPTNILFHTIVNRQLKYLDHTMRMNVDKDEANRNNVSKAFEKYIGPKIKKKSPKPQRRMPSPATPMIIG